MYDRYGYREKSADLQGTLIACLTPIIHACTSWLLRKIALILRGKCEIL